MSITCALLTMEAMKYMPNLMDKGWDYPVHTLSHYATELDRQTKGWDWEVTLHDTRFGSWADMVQHLAKGITHQICDESVPEIPWAMQNFLKEHFPQKFLRKYSYRIPTINLWGGFDEGIVEAIDYLQAREFANKTITEGFDKINSVLKANNLPCFEYYISELEIKQV